MWDKKIEAALQWSRNTQWDRLDPFNYRASYLSLIELFKTYVQIPNYNSVVAGSLAVYGWMPTILKHPPSEQQWDRYKDTLQQLRLAQNWEVAKSFLKKDANILKLANDSVVGTSKFLHFLNPEVFPIWDSRIAKCIGLRHNYQIDNPQNYLEYACAVHSEIYRARFDQRFLAFVGNVSPIRKLEMLLFLYGGRKQKRGKKQ